MIRNVLQRLLLASLKLASALMELLCVTLLTIFILGRV